MEKRREVEREQERKRERERRDHVRPGNNSDYHDNSQTVQQPPVIVVVPQNVDGGTTAYGGGGVGTAPAASTAAPVDTASTGGGVPSATPAAPAVSEYGPRYQRKPETAKSHASVLCAPGGDGRALAVGIQYLTSQNYGVGLWLSGDFGQDEDVIPATIPHNDFYEESTTGTCGLEALYGIGSNAAMLVVGAGLSVDQVGYTDISNATGWKWDGGKKTRVQPAAQIGFRFQLGARVGLHIGYDTAQRGFFGLSATF